MNTLLTEILLAREQRVKKQNQLLDKYKKPLLCFTMNIPGPEKCNRDVSIGFAVGNWLLQDALRDYRVVHKEQNRLITGCEAYYVVDMPARELKRLAVELEDIAPVGRLFDMDVLDTDGTKLSRSQRRKCLICDEDAVICARSRAHGLEQLQDRTGFLLFLCARQWMTEFITARAYLALIQEVSVTPKPGLVDRNNTGSHKDMGTRHFFTSANALRPFFFRFAETGFLTRDQAPQEVLPQLRAIGMEAEAAMLSATGGVNTHKGAIFSLGIVCAAAGRLDPALWQADRLLSECAAITKGIVARDFSGITEKTAKTAGERLYASFGITGVRGQAEAGFPAVQTVGLPVLRQGLGKGLSFNDAAAAALLHLIAATDDTNLIHRSDRQTQLAVQKEISRLLEADPYPARERIEQLDREFIQRNLSPGGSADLLALTCLVYFLET